jgi:hypothetical protein
MNKVTFKIEAAYRDEKILDTTEVVSEVGDTIDEVLMVVVRGLIGMGFSENLIRDYMNYKSEDWKVYRLCDGCEVEYKI